MSLISKSSCFADARLPSFLNANAKTLNFAFSQKQCTSYKPPHRGYKVRHLSTSTTTPLLHLTRAMATQIAQSTTVDAGSHDEEMHSALTAVRLASKLCQVRFVNAGISGLIRFVALIYHAHCAKICSLKQRVQLQLKSGEKTDKADESPVTVADYGEPRAIKYCTSDAI